MMILWELGFVETRQIQTSSHNLIRPLHPIIKW
jgi:hypothetical protein